MIAIIAGAVIVYAFLVVMVFLALGFLNDWEHPLTYLIYSAVAWLALLTCLGAVSAGALLIISGFRP